MVILLDVIELREIQRAAGIRTGQEEFVRERRRTLRARAARIGVEENLVGHGRRLQVEVLVRGHAVRCRRRSEERRQRIAREPEVRLVLIGCRGRRKHHVIGRRVGLERSRRDGPARR